MTTPYPGLGSIIQQVGGTAPKATSKTTPATTGYEKVVTGDKGSAQGNEGNGILSTLSLPQGINPWSTFTWNVRTAVPVKPGGGLINGPFVPGNNPNRSTLTQMTMAGAVSWLRTLAMNNGSPGGPYDQIVHQLVAAGYLTPAEARYGSFTTVVANKFLQSAADVWNVNNQAEQANGDAGQLMTWGDHMQALIDARKASGQIDPTTELPIGSGSGSAGPQAPTRKDNYTNPEDVKKAVNDAAENLLGRKLTDSEVAQFQSAFKAQEKTANDQSWAQTMSAFNNQSSTPNTAPALVNPPSPTSAAANYMDSAPQFGQEKSDTLLGSYIGVLRNMVGMGSGGVSHAVG